jgi:hypothetical protein
MELAGGLLAGSHVARHSGAGSHVRSGRARIVRRLDDPILRARWATRIPRVDHARVVSRVWDCLGTLPCIDPSAVESLSLNTCAASRSLGQDQNSRQCDLSRGLQGSGPLFVHVHCRRRSANRCADSDPIDCS